MALDHETLGSTPSPAAMIKVIIFDLGGPIVDWEEGMNAVYRKHEDHRNLERDTLRNLFQQYIDGGLVGNFHSIAHFFDKTRPTIDMTIEELKKKYKIALLSNFSNGLENFLQEVFKIYHLFDLVVSSYNVKMKKPDRRIYEHTIEKLGILPEEAVFIDNLEENVKGAEAVGIKGIIFKDVEQCRFDLNKFLSK